MSTPLERLGALAVRLKAAAMNEADPDRRALLDETAEAVMAAIKAVADYIARAVKP